MAKKSTGQPKGKGLLGMKPGINPMIKPADRTGSGKDKMGAYPANVRVPVLEGRRYLWTTRVFAIGFYLSMILNTVLVLTIFAMMPLKKIEPFLVSFSDKQDQVVRIQPAAMVRDGFGVFVEQMAGEFVKIRQEFLADADEQVSRWNVYLRSRMLPVDFGEFIKSVEPIYQELQRKGFHRTVEVTGINRGNTKNFVAVRYKTIDYDRVGNPVLEMNWIAKLRYGFYQQDTNNRDKYLNPFGFKVLSYSVQREQ